MDITYQMCRLERLVQPIHMVEEKTEWTQNKWHTNHNPLKSIHVHLNMNEGKIWYILSH